MKSLAELQAIRKSVGDRINLRDGAADCRVVVGMATCGIAAGARPVLNALQDELHTMGIGDRVIVTQCGCIGICQFEPVVEVFEPGKTKVTYVKMTAEKARRVAVEHIRDGHIVTEYTIGASEK
ncbi:MAG: (2Fe-2S) ferredoxin domain-containing protein [Firmicutes bacterium]|nr:(2Fe-2S) ferredoxin domain-containing protein [Bacillota bacterium]